MAADGNAFGGVAMSGAGRASVRHGDGCGSEDTSTTGAGFGAVRMTFEWERFLDAGRDGAMSHVPAGPQTIASTQPTRRTIDRSWRIALNEARRLARREMHRYDRNG